MPNQTFRSGQLGSAASAIRSICRGVKVKVSPPLCSGDRPPISSARTSVRNCRERSSERIRPGRLVSTWKMCCCACAITANTFAMYASETPSWNRSLIELTKIIRGRVHRNGWLSRSGSSRIMPLNLPPSASPA
jgi:hypothetical protein